MRTSLLGQEQPYGRVPFRSAAVLIQVRKDIADERRHVCKRAETGFSAALAACQSRVLAKSLYAGTIARISRFRGAAP